jgi:hypothetical protein
MRGNSGAPQAPEVLVETVDDDGEMITPVTVDTHQINMFAMSNERGMPEDDQDDSQDSSNDTPDDATSHRPLDPDTERIHSRIDAFIVLGGTLPTIEVANLLGCTFISEPDETGEQMWAKISRIEATEETSADYTQRMYKFQCEVRDKVFEEIKTYNQMLDWVDQDLHKDDMFAFELIKAHRLHPDPTGEKEMGMDNAARGSYQLLVEWASGETTWVHHTPGETDC